MHTKLFWKTVKRFVQGRKKVLLFFLIFDLNKEHRFHNHLGQLSVNKLAIQVLFQTRSLQSLTINLELSDKWNHKL